MNAGVIEEVRAGKGTGLERTNATNLADAVVPALQASPFQRLDQIPAEHRPPAVTQTKTLIGGELIEWTGKTMEVRSPIPVVTADGAVVQPVIGTYPSMDAKAALDALNAAKRANNGGRGEWAMMTAEQRIASTERFLAEMPAVRSTVVNRLMWEIGKTLPDSQKEFDRTMDYIRDSIVEVRAIEAEGAKLRIKNGIAYRTEHNPVGVALCMGPFNYPLNETFTTVMPLILMGNSVVIKVPKIGVLLYEPLLEAFQKCYPPGVVNFVYGDGAETVTPMMQDGGVDVLAFIGSGKVADIITKTHKAPHRLKLILGLGAKNPGVVLPDADLGRAVDECVAGALTYNGQRCTALKEIFVHSSVAEEFVERFSAKVSALRQGMPWVKGTQITPVAEPGKVEYLRGLIDDAVAHGARVTNVGGGEAANTLFTPAVLYPVSPKARLYTEEQFGPVVPIIPFNDAREVVDYLKDSTVGQQLAVFGKDPEGLKDFARQTRNLVARVNFNTQCQRGPDEAPFGARKSSGQTTLSTRAALLASSIETVYACKDEPGSQELLAEAV